uniref:KilA-N domain-containing protein n=1 Tax=Prevotella sp. GTC17260 TaxID=3236796 RepID=A0AB33JFY9_9BACT
MKGNTKKINVQGTEISVLLKGTENDYICLTDMARFRDTERTNYIIQNWMRSRNTIEYLGVWELLNNPDFKRIEFDAFKNQAGLNSFSLTPKEWVEKTNAIGIYSKAGRYGGTYAHKDIAFNFGMWLSPTFQLYVVKEYQQLKEHLNDPRIGNWNVKRILSKANYSLHTDAIKSIMIPKLSISKTKYNLVYATEADLLNLAVFGYTAKDWEELNPELSTKLNMRDTASINELVVLSNIESINSELIKQDISRDKRLNILHRIAKEQLRVLNEQNAENKFRKLSNKDIKGID